MSSRRIWWIGGGLLVAFVVVVCLLPGNELPQTLLNDKWNHLLAYFGLAAYFAGLVERPRWWQVFLWLLALGIAIEIAQGAMHAGREADVRDVAANSIGALAGIIGARLGLARWPVVAERLLGRAAP